MRFFIVAFPLKKRAGFPLYLFINCHRFKPVAIYKKDAAAIPNANPIQYNFSIKMVYLRSKNTQ
jgi:hypothetical protein